MQKTIKFLIWLYIILLIFEGSLRKWVFPGQADALLIIRDPVVLAIYALALGSGRFPFNGFVATTLMLAGMSIVASFVAGQGNLVVMVYGLRIDYLHLPLIWIMADLLTRRDVEKIGTFLLLVVLPMTAIMVIQFKSPANAFINRGIGNDEGNQIFGADGKIRPPGFFSFITGPQMYYPLVAAFFLHQVSQHRRLWWPVLAACGLAILLALPVSISRTVMLATVGVAAAWVCCLPLTGTLGAGKILRIAAALAVCGIAASFLPVFKEGREVFMNRWDTAATTTQGNAWGGIVDRLLTGVLQPFSWAGSAPLFGHGIGVGSNVGSRLLQGKVGFMLAEDEWGKDFLELGPVLGGLFIGFRLVLAGYLAFKALQVLFRRRDNLPILLVAANALAVAQFQWAPPTILGFAVVGAGLTLAAATKTLEDEEEEDEEDEDEGEEDREEDGEEDDVGADDEGEGIEEEGVA